MPKRIRPAIELVSDIGSLGFDLQQHTDSRIVEAVKLCRSINPEMFAWLVDVLGSKRSEPEKAVGRPSPSARSPQQETEQ